MVWAELEVVVLARLLHKPFSVVGVGQVNERLVKSTVRRGDGCLQASKPPASTPPASKPPASKPPASKIMRVGIRQRTCTRSDTERPLRSATPYSVTIVSTSFREMETLAPGRSVETILLSPFLVMERKAMMPRPPSERWAAMCVSAAPPTPDSSWCPMDSEQTWPVKSSSTHVLIECIL